MMRHTLIVVGKIRAHYLNSGIEDYLKRMRPYAHVTIIEVKEEKAPDGLNASEEEKIKHIETERLIERTPQDSIVIALDPRGKSYTSEMWGTMVQNWMNTGRTHVSWLIGGSFGLADDVLPHHVERWSLSSLTFTHGLTRLIVLEQLYRAYKIIRGEPYHK